MPEQTIIQGHVLDALAGMPEETGAGRATDFTDCTAGGDVGGRSGIATETQRHRDTERESIVARNPNRRPLPSLCSLCLCGECPVVPETDR